MMTNERALEALKELGVAHDAGLIEEWDARQRAAHILDRAGLAELDLTAYLQERGFSDYRLAAAMGPFAKAVKARYREVYGVSPLMRVAMIAGRPTGVMAYLGMDRPIVDAVYADLFDVVDAAVGA